MTPADRYARDGYAVLEGIFAGDRLEALRAEVAAVATGARGPILGADLVRGESDAATLANVLAVHFPHKISPVCRDALSEPAIVRFLNAVIGPDVKAVQSMLFVKPAGKPGQPWHQDEPFIPTRDRSLCGVWIALDDADTENGCLWVLPGSHAAGILWPMRDQDAPGFDGSQVAHGFPEDEDAAVPVEVRAGDVVCFGGYLLHGSRQNVSADRSRRALVNHYMNARSLLPWHMAGPREDWRDVVMVSGEDPYAWKGTEEIVVPFVRPEGKEGQARLRQLLAEGARA